MEFISNLLQSVAAVVALGETVKDWGGWLIRELRNRLGNSRTDEVRQWFQQLGMVSESDVRQMVKDWARQKDIPQADQEELTILLTNLTRGARFQTTHGHLTSSFVNCARLLDQLISDIQPIRNRGEAVCSGKEEWVLERFLGMGTFGEVWLAQNKHYPTPRAFKFFTHEGAGEWIAREQHALFHVKRKLGNHPNIVDFLDVSLAAKPHAYLELEYVSGGSLEDWILSHDQERRPLNVSDVVEGVARGLAKAHAERIYHRDLKPANVLLTDEADPQPKITDFGLGSVERDSMGSISAQHSQGLMVGTRMYLPPEAEEVFGERSPAQDDVFAFGVLWYQLLVQRIERPAYDFVEELRSLGVDSETVRLLERCLAHPSRRFRDAVELLDALQRERVDPTWSIPEGCFDVGPLVSEYLNSHAGSSHPMLQEH